ncbi:MAG: NifB/NifX family molybdenum-iron cluster-binding protein [bacterium]
MRFAVPLADGVLCNHFGHCQQFAMIEAEGEQVVKKELLTPPPHEPGVIPRWLQGMGVQVIIAGGMGARAMGMFQEMGIRVVTGAPMLPPETLVEQYLRRTLQTGANVCDH